MRFREFEGGVVGGVFDFRFRGGVVDEVREGGSSGSFPDRPTETFWGGHPHYWPQKPHKNNRKLPLFALFFFFHTLWG